MNKKYFSNFKKILFDNLTVNEIISNEILESIESYYTHESFDGIISSASLVHMNTEIGKKVLKKVYKLLKKS